MGKIKEYLKDKSVGFYYSVALCLLTLITVIIYVSNYGNSRDMSWWAFAFVLVGLLGAIALIVFKQYNWAPVALAVFNGLGLMFFIHSIAFYVSVVLVGIDAYEYSAEFLVSIVFLIITFVLSVPNIFLRQIKKDKNTSEKFNEQQA